MGNMYAIERESGYVMHYVTTRKESELYGSIELLVLTFNSEEKASEVAKALKGNTKVVEYYEEILKAA